MSAERLLKRNRVSQRARRGDSMDETQGTAAAELTRIGPDPKLVGVKGWLAFFCVSLIVINPLATLGMLMWSFSLVAPAFNQYPGFVIVFVIDAVVSIALMGLSMFAGISLWRIRPGAVKLAKLFLLAGAAYLLISPLFIFLSGLPREAILATLPDSYFNSGRSLVYYAIWLNYLRSSKRVKATFDMQTPD